MWCTGRLEVRPGSSATGQRALDTRSDEQAASTAPLFNIDFQFLSCGVGMSPLFFEREAREEQSSAFIVLFEVQAGIFDFWLRSCTAWPTRYRAAWCSVPWGPTLQFPFPARAAEFGHDFCTSADTLGVAASRCLMRVRNQENPQETLHANNPEEILHANNQEEMHASNDATKALAAK